jgi:hypothetical protein
VAQGASFTFSYAIRNQGGLPAGLNSSSWDIDQKPIPPAPVITNFKGSTPSPAPIMPSDTISSLAGGTTSATFTHSIDTTNLTVGMHTLWVAADWMNQVGESDETNNWTSISFNVTQPTLPDLIVSNLTLGVTSLMQGASLSFSYAIRNQGGLLAGLNYSAWAIDQKPQTSNPIGDTIGSLAAGATTATFSNSIDTTNLTIGMHTGRPHAGSNQRDAGRTS